ncbi:MAG TPA: diacylglycerol kinase family protein [Candidatus Limnocylindria bacterium]
MTPPAPIAIFMNELAGSARTPRVQEAVTLAQQRLGADLHIVATRDPNMLTTWMAEHLESYRTIIVVGGDGSFGVGYNAVAGSDVVLGYIPAGFGNATAHLLGLSREPEALASTLAAAEARPVDLVSIDGRLALFAGTGWDAIVAGRYADGGAKGMLGWAGAVVLSIPDLIDRHDVRVEADGVVVHDGPIELLVISTTPWFGRGLRVNPGARLDAGRLTLRIYPGPLPAFLPEAARWLAKRKPRARAIHAQRVSITSTDGRPVPVQADGDLIGRQSAWSFEIRPAAVRMIGHW